MQAVSYGDAIQQKFPEQIALANSIDEKGKANTLTLGWAMCTSHQPPMLAISVAHARYSHHCIKQGREFVVVFPSVEQADDVLYVGTYSGRNVDKFAKTKLKAIPATKVKPPLIADAVACFECKLVAECDSGDHTIFVGEVVASHVGPERLKRVYSLPDGTMGGVG